MPKRNPTVRKARKAAAPAAAQAQASLRTTWNNTLDTLASAEQRVGKQVQGLLKNKSVSEARESLVRLQARLESERKRGMRKLEAQLKTLRARVEKQRRGVAKSASDAVQSTLAALNIPSRSEIAALTRKVDELQRKITRPRRK